MVNLFLDFAPREIKAALCFKRMNTLWRPFGGKDGCKEKDWGNGGFGFVSFYEILKICSLTEVRLVFICWGGFWGAVFCSGKSPTVVRVLVCDQDAAVKCTSSDPSGVTAKDQKVAMSLNRKWDCSDNQGSGPFPGILEPHKFPGSMLILKVIASIMTRTGPILPNLPISI